MVTLIRAAAQSADLGIYSTLINLGLAGVIIILFLKGVIVTGKSLEEEKKAREAQDEWLKNDAIPLVTNMAGIVKEIVPLLVELKHERDKHINWPDGH